MRVLRRDSAATIFPQILTRGDWLAEPIDFRKSFGLTVFCILDSQARYSRPMCPSCPAFFEQPLVLRLKNISVKENRKAALRDG